MYSILSEQEESFDILLNADHFIYKAHFPGQPITPGVCIIKIAAELLEKKLSRKLRLKVVKNVKFSATLSPLENPRVTFKILKLTEEEGNVITQIEVIGFAKLSLIFA